MGSSASWRLVRQGEPAPFEVTGDTIVGRSRQADLCLAEGYVSRRHARLWIESGGLMVEDLGSANGTYVNGERVQGPQRLSPGDCVTFDAFDYFVEAIAPRFEGDPNATGLESPADPTPVPTPDAAGAPTAEPARPSVEATQPLSAVTVEEGLPPLDDPDFDLTAFEDADNGGLAQTVEADILPPPEPPAAPSAAPAATEAGSPSVHPPAQPPPSALAATVNMNSGESRAVAPTQAMPSAEYQAQGPGLDVEDPSAPALLATAGPLEGNLIHLEPGRILLGRGVESDIWIDHPAVSRQHLEIFLSGGRCRIRQLEGAKGTMLNGKPVQDAELLPGDVLRVGSVEFVFDSIESLTRGSSGLPPWLWMLVGFVGAGAILAGLFVFVL